jgi:small subunit ribosomal protein S9
MVKKQEKIMVSGKRKTAIAKALIKQGSGEIKINKKPYQHLPDFKKLMIQEPVEIAKQILGSFNFDIGVNIKGGGQESQIEAARLAIAKALVKFTKSVELRKAFLAYDRNLLIADVRRKEPYKPGDSKARKLRQKSYR